MKKLLLLSFISSLTTFAAVAQYSVHSLSGDIKLKKGMQYVTVTKGMQLSAADVLELGEDAAIEIFNASNSQTYKCTKPGSSSVSGIMISATSLAANKGKSIRDNMNFSRSSASGTGHVYVESGMVKRSMATYDPEARNIEVDPRELSRFVVNALRNPEAPESQCPAAFTHSPNPDGGLSFSIGNTLSSPIYFNVIKVADSETSKISISELGQPSGSYVLLPAQTLSREQLAPLPENERHILIMTHFNFDVDKLIEHIEASMQSGDNSTPDSALNVYMSPL